MPRLLPLWRGIRFATYNTVWALSSLSWRRQRWGCCCCMYSRWMDQKSQNFITSLHNMGSIFKKIFRIWNLYFLTLFHQPRLQSVSSWFITSLCPYHCSSLILATFITHHPFTFSFQAQNMFFGTVTRRTAIGDISTVCRLSRSSAFLFLYSYSTFSSHYEKFSFFFLVFFWFHLHRKFAITHKILDSLQVTVGFILIAFHFSCFHYFSVSMR